MRKIRKTYFVILCGAGDRASDLLGGRTPLEVANVPVLDKLTINGRLGSVHIIDGEVPPESDSGAMALLSYDPRQYYTGRGPLEGLGLGFERLGKYSASFRVNFGSFDARRRVLDRRTARDLADDELQGLAASLRDEIDIGRWGEVGFELVAFSRHRGVICFYSDTVPLCGDVTNTDPGFIRKGPFGIPVHHDNRPLICKPMCDAVAAENTAELINWFVDRSAGVLASHPVNARRSEAGKLAANILLFRDGGDHPKPIPSFFQRFERTVSFYGQIPAEKGLMDLIGGRFVSARRREGVASGRYHAELVRDMHADPADVVAVHLKGVDEHGHDGSAEGKISGIEMLDAEFLAPLVSRLGDDDVVIVACDHATPFDLRLHSADMVPVLISGAHIPADKTDKFCEAQSVHGDVASVHACQLLKEVFSHEEALR